MKKSIIVAGYPKSGNTWITRLVAELVACPVGGYLRGGLPWMAEATERQSDYICYKSHHSLRELDGDLDAGAKVIYVMRDPRDVCISASHYFYNYKVFGEHFGRFSGPVGRLANKLAYKTFGMRIMKERMATVMLEGNKDYPWCRVPWKMHVTEFTGRKDILTVRYEDALEDTERESRRILDFLRLNRTDAEIAEAVRKQSFSYKKHQFLKQSRTDDADFLREGASEQWREKISPKLSARFTDDMGELLERLGYPLA